MADIKSIDVDFRNPTVLPSSAPLQLPPSQDENEVPDIAVAMKKKRRPYRHKKFGCTVAEHIKKAVKATKERRGISVAAMKKMLSASGCKLRRKKPQVTQPVRSFFKQGSLVSASANLAASTSVRPDDAIGKLDIEAKKGEESTVVSVFEARRNYRRKPVLHRKKAAKKRGKPARGKLLKSKRWARWSKKRPNFRKTTPIRRSVSCNPVCQPQEESNAPNGSSQSH